MLQWFATGALVLIAFALIGILSTLEKWNRHMANIADRLLDIQRLLDKRRP
jgi:hypothetical protein